MTRELSNTIIELSGDGTATAHLTVGDLAPGDRDSISLSVRYQGDGDAQIRLYADAATDSALARQLRLVIFESSDRLLPFPIYNGTFADFATRVTHRDGIGRWTARGDGTPHAVTYELQWTLPKTARPTTETADLTVVCEAA